MADQDNKDVPVQSNEIKAPEKINSSGEQTVHFKQEIEKNLEKNIPSEDDKIVSEELRRQIEMLELDPTKEKDIEVEKEKIGYLGEKEKIEHLLKTAREKGLVYAIQLVRSMNEPYLLDVLHDTLAREGYYKDFLSKRTDDDTKNDDDTKDDKKT